MEKFPNKNQGEKKKCTIKKFGTFGYGLEFADFVPLEEIGGIIVKGTTLEPREGNAMMNNNFRNLSV